MNMRADGIDANRQAEVVAALARALPAARLLHQLEDTRP